MIPDKSQELSGRLNEEENNWRTEIEAQSAADGAEGERGGVSKRR